MLILLAFAIVFAIEFKTLLGMFGVDVASNVYFPIAGLVIIAAFTVLQLLPEGRERRPSST